MGPGYICDQAPRNQQKALNIYNKETFYNEDGCSLVECSGVEGVKNIYVWE